jgi:hypothetical protein
MSHISLCFSFDFPIQSSIVPMDFRIKIPWPFADNINPETGGDGLPKNDWACSNP